MTTKNKTEIEELKKWAIKEYKELRAISTPECALDRMVERLLEKAFKSQKLTCTNCKKEISKEYVSIECPVCYIKSCDYEIKKALTSQTEKFIEIIDKIYHKLKENEYEKLYSLPQKVAVNLQSGFLLGYADSLVKFREELKSKLGEQK